MKLLPLFVAFILGLLFNSNGFADDLEQSIRSQIGEVNKSEASLFYRIPFASLHMYYYVPPTLTAILDLHTDEELVPALTALKSSVDASDALLVQGWISIVRSHVRGTPNTVDVPSGSYVTHIPVIRYSLPLSPRRP